MCREMVRVGDDCELIHWTRLAWRLILHSQAMVNELSYIETFRVFPGFMGFNLLLNKLILIFHYYEIFL